MRITVFEFEFQYNKDVGYKSVFTNYSKTVNFQKLYNVFDILIFDTLRKRITHKM